jgi:hypothetical protein
MHTLSVCSRHKTWNGRTCPYPPVPLVPAGLPVMNPSSRSSATLLYSSSLSPLGLHSFHCTSGQVLPQALLLSCAWHYLISFCVLSVPIPAILFLMSSTFCLLLYRTPSAHCILIYINKPCTAIAFFICFSPYTSPPEVRSAWKALLFVLARTILSLYLIE